MAKDLIVNGVTYPGTDIIDMLTSDGSSAVYADMSDTDVTPEKMMEGTRARGADGEPVVGTFSIDNELSDQTGLIGAIKAELSGKAGLAVGANGLRGKKVSFLGDSITTFSGYIPSGYAAWYPNSGAEITTVDETWWMQFLAAGGMELVKNCSWSGSRITGVSTGSSAAAGCSDKRVADLRGDDGTAPEIIIVLIGINDFNAGVEVGEWDGTSIPADGTVATVSEAFALLAYKLANAYPTAEVFFCTLPESKKRSWGNDYNSAALAEYNKAICFVAECFGFNNLDMHTCGINYYNIGNYTVDQLHPNATGAKRLAKKALAEVSTKSIYSVLLSDESVDVSETWYIAPSKPTAVNVANPAYASFAYNQTEVIAACIGVPINAIRLYVAVDGTMSYGKISASEYTTLGSITLKDGDSGKRQVYKLPETIKLSAGERLWFGAPTDVGCWYYDYTPQSATGRFDMKLSANDLVGSATTQNLCVDIGYIPGI
jgi:lysophospholipase L1-like esterase